jgi:hypothetical protein
VATSTKRTLAAICATTAALCLGLGALAPAAVAVPVTGASHATDAAARDDAASALDRLRAAGMLVESGSPTESAGAAAVRAPALAVTFGKVFFKYLGLGAGHMGFEVLTEELGFGSSDKDLVNALTEIGASVEQLNAQVQAMSAQVEALLDGQDRANFYDSYSRSGQAASRLSVAMASVRSWIAQGTSPSPAHVSDMQTVIRTSVSDLAFQLVNPTTGTVPLMMRAAEPSKVSAELPAYWRTIDTARDDFRAVLAQGLGTLDLVQRWDTTGTVAADLETLSEVSADTVLQMYRFGLRIADADGQPYVHTRDTTEVMAAPLPETVPPAGSAWATQPSRETWVVPFLQRMVDAYRPALHGGATLEEYLRERGIPTRFVHAESIQTQATQRPNGKPYRNEVVHQERVRITDVRGNVQVTEWRNLGGERVAYEVVQVCRGGGGIPVTCTWEPLIADAPVAADARAEQERQAWEVSMTTRDARWLALDYHGPARATVLRATTAMNVAGIAADLNPDRVWAAAFDAA